MALSLNISNALISNATPIAGYPFSLMGWFRIPDVDTLTSLLGIVSFSSGSRCDVLFAGDTTKAVVAKTETGSSTGVASSTIAMSPNTWHHIVAVFASDTSRTIYLDGGNAGVNTDSVSATALNFFYFGNITDTTNIDLAEVSIVTAAVSAEQAASLANGCPLLSTPLARDTVAYLDCIRQLNRPGLGPLFSSSGTPSVVDHPRVFSSTGGFLTAMPLRYGGPWLAEQAEFRPHSAEIGQLATAGMVLNNSILSGEVMS